jgi:hypothetical protein
MAVNINIPSEVTQTITNGVTITAPSENAVFDALSLKANAADLSEVATSGDYNDLINQPSIPNISGLVPYTDAVSDVDLGQNAIKVEKVYLYDGGNDNYGSVHYSDGDFHIEDADGHPLLVIEDGFMQLHLSQFVQSNLFTTNLTEVRNHYLPDASGTIALTSDIPNIQVDITSPTSGAGLEYNASTSKWIDASIQYTIELIDALTVDFYAPYNMKIDSVTNIKNSPTITLKKEGATYTLGTSITAGNKITVQASVASVVNLNISKI